MTQLTGLLELSLAFKLRPCKEFGAGSIGLRFGVGPSPICSRTGSTSARSPIGVRCVAARMNRSSAATCSSGRDGIVRLTRSGATKGLLIATGGNTTDFKFIEAARSCAASRTKGCR